MGATERRKGHDFERWIARQLCDFGFPAERLLEYQAGKGWDVICFGGEGMPRILVQAKRRKSIAWLKEVDKSFSEDYPLTELRMWVLREDRGGPVAVVRLSDLFNLLHWSKVSGFWKVVQAAEEEKKRLTPR